MTTKTIRAKRVILPSGICELRLVGDAADGFIVNLEVE